MYSLTINTDNAAFEDDAAEELARILEAAAAQVRNGKYNVSLRDVNGNKVGRAEWTEQGA